MNDEEFIKMLRVSAILFKYNVPVNEAKIVGAFIEELQQENQELKKQLEEINDFINKANFANIEQLMLDYCAKTEEQKEFIDWLENLVISDMGVFTEIKVCDVLSKYKEIIGGKE